MGLLDGLNFDRGMSQAGYAAGQIGQMGVQSEIMEMRERRLRGEERQYQKQQAGLQNPQKIEYHETNEAGELVLKTAIYQGGKLVKEHSADAAKVAASKRASADKSTSLKDWRDDLRSELLGRMKMDGDPMSWSEDQQAKYGEARAVAERITFSRVAAGQSLDSINQGEIVRDAIRIVDGDTTIEAVLGGTASAQPAAKSGPLEPDEIDQARVQLNTEPGGGLLGRSRDDDYVPFNEYGEDSDRVRARAYENRQPARPQSQNQQAPKPWERFRQQ